MDFIICANNFLNNIARASLFEKIITNKYELITRKYLILTKGKIQDYILPPLIKYGESNNNKILYMLDIKIKLLKKTTLIFINCINDNIINFIKCTNVIHIDSNIEIFYEKDNIFHINPNDVHYKNKKLIELLLDCDDIIIFNNSTNELKTLTLSIHVFSLCILNIKFDGNIYYEFMFFKNDESLNFFYYISKYFEKVIYHKNILEYDKFGFIQFKNFNNNTNSPTIEQLYSILHKYNIEGGGNPTPGPFGLGPQGFEKRLYPNNPFKKRLYPKNSGGDMPEEPAASDPAASDPAASDPNENICIYIVNNTVVNEPPPSYFPKLDLPQINEAFLKFILNIYKMHTTRLETIYNRILYVRQHYKKISREIDPFITTLVNNGISFCKKNKLEITRHYIDFKPLNYKSFINIYFKKINKVNLDKIKLSLDSNYSITSIFAAEKLIKYIKKTMPDVEYIIDGNANIGSTAAILSLQFTHIYSVELIKDTYDILDHNIREYKLPNVSTFNDSIITFMGNIKDNCKHYDPLTFCLFLDPPWTGVFYKIEKNIDLYLDHINIIDFIKGIKSIKYICLKVPFNYNFADLYKEFYNIIIYRLSGFYCVLITI